eukprot:s714_g10.t1
MAKLKKHQNALGQYSSLGSEVFFTEYGSDWTSYRSARNRRRIDFRDPQFGKEQVDGHQLSQCHEGHKNLRVSQTADPECIQEWLRNMLTHVKLVNSSLTEINLSHNELVKLPEPGDERGVNKNVQLELFFWLTSA